MISAHHLSFTYGNQAALTDISFELGTGIHFLLGPNGAGKSTLFALITQLYSLQQGDIRFQQHSLKTLSYRANCQLGVMFQQLTLDLDLSISQNLCYFGALHGMSQSDSLAAATPLLQQFQLADRLNHSVRSLNTGHRRRLEIVRALMHSPRILLLDEPSVGLDPDSRRQLIDTVRKSSETRKVCVLWATHLLDEPMASDTLLILHQGRLLASGVCSQLMDKASVSSVADLFDAITKSRAQ